MTILGAVILVALVFGAALYAAHLVVRRAAPPPRTVEDLAREVLAGQGELRILIERVNGRLDEQRVYLDARSDEIDRLKTAVADIREQLERRPLRSHP